MGFFEFLSEIRRVLKNLIDFRVSSIAENNKNSYNSLAQVQAYATMTNLRKPEQTIINLLKTKPKFGKLLDIGVGAGRTAKYFKEISEEYVGIDYSENMIKECKRNFANDPKVSFAVADARKLSIFDDNVFDFVLFSHGGLDSVEHQDRIKILREIWRVTKNGGYFFFSTANLDAMPQFCKIRLSKNPRIFARILIRLLLIRILNPEVWALTRGKSRNLEHAMFIMGSDDWSLKTYCITAKAQVKQLEELGFGNLGVYRMQGKKANNLENINDFELHYLFNIKKPIESLRLHSSIQEQTEPKII